MDFCRCDITATLVPWIGIVSFAQTDVLWLGRVPYCIIPWKTDVAITITVAIKARLAAPATTMTSSAATTATATASPSFSGLPDDLQSHCLSFIRGQYDALRPMELTCKAFRGLLLRQDDLWQTELDFQVNPDSPEDGGIPARFDFSEDHRFHHRTRHQMRRAMELVWHEQKRVDNVFLTVMGHDGFSDFAHTVINEHSNVWITDGRRFVLRGDTLGTLAEILQATLLEVFQLGVNMDRWDVSANDSISIPMGVFVNAHASMRMSFEHRGIFHNPMADYVELPEYYALDAGRDVLLRLSRRAGIPRIPNLCKTGESFDPDLDKMWRQCCEWVFVLCFPGCLGSSIAEENDADQTGHDGRSGALPVLPQRPLESFIPPARLEGKVWVHTLIPRQIEESSKEFGLFRKVYMPPWVGSHNPFLPSSETNEASPLRLATRLSLSDDGMDDCSMGDKPAGSEHGKDANDDDDDDDGSDGDDQSCDGLSMYQSDEGDEFEAMSDPEDYWEADIPRW